MLGSAFKVEFSSQAISEFIFLLHQNLESKSRIKKKKIEKNVKRATVDKTVVGVPVDDSFKQLW